MATTAHRAGPETRRRTPALLALLLCLCAALTVCPSTVRATPDYPVGGALLGSHGVIRPQGTGVPELPRVKASSYVVTDLDTGQVLAAKDPHGKYAPASTLKVLTALAAFPHIRRDQQVRPTYSDMSVDGTKVGIDRRRTYKARDLCLAMLMMSANDAAEAVARAAGGGGHKGRARTIAAMNAKARKLQAYDTHAHTPTGLDAKGQTSSAYDLSLFFRTAMKRKDFRSYLHKRTSRFPALKHGKTYQIASHNHLLWQYRGAIGGKNGFTEKARASYVGAARRGGHTISVALMHDRPNFWPDAVKLLNWGFAARGRAVPIGLLVPPVTQATASASPSQAAGGSGVGVTTTDVPAGPPAWLLPVVFVVVLIACGGLAFYLYTRQRVRRAVRRARGGRRPARARARSRRAHQPPPPPPPRQQPPTSAAADSGVSIAHPVWPSDHD